MDRVEALSLAAHLLRQQKSTKYLEAANVLENSFEIRVAKNIQRIREGFAVRLERAGISRSEFDTVMEMMKVANTPETHKLANTKMQELLDRMNKVDV